MSTDSGRAGWDIRTAGPHDAARRALLLPGALCTAEFLGVGRRTPKTRTARAMN
ncbi:MULTISPECIES: hypothetical protein [unclassified Streptomyces]|uniref:hypothetical protein n=1 Tax=unclassified Streptomyces TaxID=2593676 RepID=UPI0003A00C7A|nr:MULTISPECIES: hypothetical protein [unclassified Streptomyces]MYX36082.1 hypothetical protein [Streptomyces sp. SID8377]